MVRRVERPEGVTCPAASHWAGDDTYRQRLSLTETIEFSFSHSSDKRMPLVRRKPQDRAFGVLAVANTDPAVRQVCHLDAVAVGEAQGALNPERIRTRPSRAAPGRKTSHVYTSLNVV
jgi:hypothetical protein